MTRLLQVGVLGAGWAGTGHASAFEKIAGVSVVALWSRSRARAEELAQSLPHQKAIVYDSWQELIKTADIDILTIATPPTLRSEPFMMALAQGLHVLVEKPLTSDLASAHNMAQAAQQSDKITATAFNSRYLPTVRLAHDLLRQNKIGQIRDIHSEWRLRWLDGGYYRARPWAQHFSVGNAELGEGMSHEFDRVCHLMGADLVQLVSIIKPYQFMQDGGLTVDGGASMHLAHFDNGVTGMMRNTITSGIDEWRTIITGEAGSLQISPTAVLIQRPEDNAPLTVPIPLAQAMPSDTDSVQFGWDCLTADFVTAVCTNAVPHTLPTIQDGLHVQQAIAAARLSANEQRWANVQQL